MQQFLGQILLVPYNFAPAGWAFCQGQTLAIAQNPALFSLIGTQFGGNGTSTFALPDLRGRVPISSGQGPGLSSYVVGEVLGQEIVTLTDAQLPAHEHPVNSLSTPRSSSSPTGHYPAGGGYYGGTFDGQMSPGMIGPAGGNQPHENRQPLLVMNYIIALVGIFPIAQLNAATRHFAAFRALVLRDEQLQDRLRSATDWDAFTRLCSALAGERGCPLSLVDLEQAKREAHGSRFAADSGQARPPAALDALVPRGWTPIDFALTETGPSVEWCDLRGLRFEDPFFTDTVQRGLREPYRLLFRPQTDIAVTAEVVAAAGRLEVAGLIFHTSRCGSTLVCRMLAQAGGTVVLCEPPPIDQVLRVGGIDALTRRRWLRAMVGALAQPRSPHDCRAVVKLDAWATRDLPLIREAFRDTPMDVPVPRSGGRRGVAAVPAGPAGGSRDASARTVRPRSRRRAGDASGGILRQGHRHVVRRRPRAASGGWPGARLRAAPGRCLHARPAALRTRARARGAGPHAGRGRPGCQASVPGVRRGDGDAAGDAGRAVGR